MLAKMGVGSALAICEPITGNNYSRQRNLHGTYWLSDIPRWSVGHYADPPCAAGLRQRSLKRINRYKPTKSATPMKANSRACSER